MDIYKVNKIQNIFIFSFLESFKRFKVLKEYYLISCVIISNLPPYSLMLLLVMRCWKGGALRALRRAAARIRGLLRVHPPRDGQGLHLGQGDQGVSSIVQ